MKNIMVFAGSNDPSEPHGGALDYKTSVDSLKQANEWWLENKRALGLEWCHAIDVLDPKTIHSIEDWRFRTAEKRWWIRRA